MTVDEYRTALRTLSGDDLRAFDEKFGGGPMGRKERVKEFAHHPEHERLICYHLGELGVEGLKTEAEKMLEAAVQSASAAKESAQAAHHSEKVAIWSVVVAAVGVVITLITAIASNPAG